jgi:hypothetical protein
VGGQFSDADLRRADAIVAISSYSTSCLTARLVRRFLLWCRIFCLTQLGAKENYDFLTGGP